MGRRLSEAGIDAEVAEGELEWLATAKRDAVIDVMVAGGELPVVLVEHEVASTGAVDVGAVVEVARRLAAL